MVVLNHVKSGHCGAEQLADGALRRLLDTGVDHFLDIFAGWGFGHVYFTVTSSGIRYAPAGNALGGGLSVGFVIPCLVIALIA